MDDSPSLDAKLLAASGAGDNAPPASVSEISGRLKRVVEGEFGYVRIRGEISGYKRAASGHVYLALKDDKAVLDGVMWKGNAVRLPFQPEDGVEVVVAGKLTTYAGRSKYQIVIESMELAGEGALMQLFEKLKAKLAGEGLFDGELKRRIPFLPKTIGVVTSPTGSVIRDILHRLADRCPSHVIVWPVLVQGEGAAKQIAAAVDGFSALPENGAVARPDLLIVARGGGSIEDLWSFNEEIVVRAVAGSSIPVISAVGHETDTTLCDFAADLRAPTPTAAAEMAVPVRAEWLASLSETRARLSRGVQRGWQTATERLEAQRRLMPALTEVLRPHQQRVDENGERLKNGLRGHIAGAQSRFARSEGALKPIILIQRANLAAERLERVSFKPDLLKRSLSESQKRFAAISRVFGQLSPDGPLKRGFARVSGPDGALVSSKEAAVAAQAVTLHFADGQVDADVGKGASRAMPAPKPAAPKTKRVKKPADDRQQDLF